MNATSIFGLGFAPVSESKIETLDRLLNRPTLQRIASATSLISHAVGFPAPDEQAQAMNKKGWHTMCSTSRHENKNYTIGINRVRKVSFASVILTFSISGFLGPHYDHAGNERPHIDVSHV
jgi:hypothetical protein